MVVQLSLAEARSIALAAQGFDGRRPRRVTIRDLARTIRRLALVQLDYVNVVVPSHYQVPFSRLGPYDRTLLERLVYGSGEFTEHWAHEASIVPTETWPLLRYRRDEHRPRPWGFDKFLRENPAYVARLLQEVRAARARLVELVASGALREARVEGWREGAYLHPEAQPARIEARSLLSPFDPVVWFRPRTRRLFGFDYRFEIFVPPGKRRWGAYVLPFLLGDRLVARVDLT